jgi:hypothetical protein
VLLIGPLAWLVGILAVIIRPGLGRSRAMFGLGSGALLAALLIAAPATGTAVATALSSTTDRTGFESYMGGQMVWLGAVVVGATGYGLSRIVRRLPRTLFLLAAEVVAIALTSALLLAGTYSAAWPVPLAPLAAGALAAIVVSRGVSAWLATSATTAVFGLTLAAVDPLALIPRLAALALGILGTAYAIGRWTDIHAAAADAPPDLVMYGSLAAGFVLVYWRPTI